MMIYHHHHVVPLARISLTLSRHFSLSFIASGRSSGLHPVSSHSCCMYVRDGNYTRMLRAILNMSWQQHPTRHQLYGHLPPITKTIQARRTRHAGHCWRSNDDLISDVLLWPCKRRTTSSNIHIWYIYIYIYIEREGGEKVVWFIFLTARRLPSNYSKGKLDSFLNAYSQSKLYFPCPMIKLYKHIIHNHNNTMKTTSDTVS